MKYFFLFLFSLAQFYVSAQNNSVQKDRKGELYVYFGWNRAYHTNSDIHFSGNDYDFTLENVIAQDRQSKFSVNTYFNPKKLTIPQYNFRIGYFFHHNYNVSIGTDHMKYVIEANQIVKINGEINNSETVYDGNYKNDDIALTRDFLEFEHTDGLNYLNVEIRRFDEIFRLGKMSINLTEGIGIGALVPKTNTSLLNNERYDQFHLSGFGINLIGALNITFLDVFFVQSELKGGFITMPNIRTTQYKSDKASQYFFFGQTNLVFGAKYNLVRLFSKKN